MVVLTVTDDAGATDTDDVMITVEAVPAPVSFATDIQPYFDANCVVCHSGGTGQAGVNLDSWAAVLTDGNNGPVVVPGDSNQGTLVPELESGDMPPGGPPAPADFIQDLRDWIDEGALDN
jgi:cytochrome c